MLLTEHHLEFLSLKGDYAGSSESIYVKMSHCWKSQVEAQIVSTLMKCRIMRHFICAFTVCLSTHFRVSRIKSVNRQYILFFRGTTQMSKFKSANIAKLFLCDVSQKMFKMPNDFAKKEDKKGTCIKGQFGPLLEPKTESCFSPILPN